ncbi:spore gernimation protein [Virgibacillus profundi]|uniref:Spore gernimation protein n=1 Tax=Virgibacillus profundi TaxID=2024555 RepID=A0A2A2I8B9_9BACI|nr:endospore germination permease [Virgibacillus profundi]PAV27822.1 spore gernimation protein [Virgibacillus profundi]PXY51949.1 spore gernimation protein [Virgibacillus profundi]
MRSFEYGDEKIGGKEIMIAIPSMVIGVGILSLPRSISVDTIGSDGWIVLVIGGLISVLMVWLMAKLASGFPHQSFFSYASTIVSKPVAIVLTFLFAILFISVAAYDIRTLGHISQQYLFDHTPVEVVTLSFLLVVVYAVAGSRAGLFRLNMLFLPIIIFIIAIVLVMNLKWLDLTNLLPVFQTDVKGYLKGIHTSSLSYMGISIVLFYIAFVDQPKKAPKMVVLGMSIPIVMYVLIYLTCLMVFGYTATSHLLFPTIDLAKRVELPGGILERVEAIFFVVWTMGVFNTTVMAVDVAIMALHSIFKKMKKMQLIFILSPVIYYIALFPRDTGQIILFGDFLGTYMVSFAFITTIVLIVIAKIRGVKPNDKTNA